MILRSLTLLTIIGLLSCQAPKTDFGTSFDASKAIPVEKAISDFKTNGAPNVTITGEVSKTCQAEGCWYNYKLSEGDLRVEFDHKFTIPKESAGKVAVATGYFYYDTTSVEALKEWAKDDNKSEEEIAKIDKPEVNLLFRASGVKLEAKK